MTDDDLLTRADKFIRAGTATDLEIDLVAALRAAKDREAKAADQLDGIFYALNSPDPEEAAMVDDALMQVIRTLREAVYARPTIREDD